MFRAKKSPGVPAEVDIEAQAKAVYKFIEKHKTDKFELDQHLNDVADKDKGKEILERVQQLAEEKIAAINSARRLHEEAKKIPQLVKESVHEAMVRKEKFDQIKFSVGMKLSSRQLVVD